MPINLKDAKRSLKIETPLGPDKLVCRSLNGQETLGRMFDYQLELLSLDRNIAFKDIVGKRVTVSVEVLNGERYFDGYVTEFRYLGTSGQFARYQATVKPWLWFLTRTSDCKIFMNKSVPDIIKEVFADNGMSDFEVSLENQDYRTWEYCVQYRETDFNFVSRLMEQEGIYYYFKHVKGKHTLVLSDGLGAHDTYSNYEKIPYFAADGRSTHRERDHVQDLTMTQQIVPGKYAIRDFDFEKPKSDLTEKLTDNPHHDYPIKDHEIYDYPGEYTESSDGRHYVKTKLEELKAQEELVHLTANARGLCSGYLFTLENYPRLSLNKQYLVVSVSHDISEDLMETSSGAGHEDFYSCVAEVMDKSQQFRSERLTPKPIVQGPQTAIVVGKKGEEIDTDKYGRVKLQFHWDRYATGDEKSSCWVRVSQLWAGKEWGGIHIPRIGQEVVVSFLEGDPDQPLVTGRVYNADNMPPYTLPDNKTQSGIKSRSSVVESGAGFNEFRFEDKVGDEEVYFQAEKNLVSLVKNDESREVQHARKTVVGSDGSPSKAIEELKVLGKREINIEGDDCLTVKKGKEGRRVEVVNGAYDLLVKEKDYILNVDRGDANITTKLGKIVIKATESIELKVGTNSIKMDMSGITIKGMMVTSEAKAIHTIKGAMVLIN